MTACSNSSERPRSAKLIMLIMSGSGAGDPLMLRVGSDEPPRRAPVGPQPCERQGTSVSVAYRDKAVELRHLAARTGARLQPVATGAQLAVVAAFDVKARVIVARVAG